MINTELKSFVISLLEFMLSLMLGVILYRGILDGIDTGKLNHHFSDYIGIAVIIILDLLNNHQHRRVLSVIDVGEKLEHKRAIIASIPHYLISTILLWIAFDSFFLYSKSGSDNFFADILRVSLFGVILFARLTILGLSILNEKDKRINKILESREKTIVIKNEQIKESYENQVRIISSIEHELGNKLPSVQLTLSDLKQHLHNLHDKKEIDLDAKIRDTIGDEKIDDVDSVSDLLNNIEFEVNDSLHIINNIRDILNTDRENLKLITGNLEEFLNKDLKKRKLPTNINVSITGDNPTLDFDHKMFQILLDNLYSNAIRHSCISKNENYTIEINLNETREVIWMNFMNNGRAFPPNFSRKDYTSFRKVSGATGHSGIGGFLINQVVKNHGGFLTIGPIGKHSNQYNCIITIHFPKNIIDLLDFSF